MCDFNNLSDEEKQHYHERLKAAAEAFGGTNYFLQLLEAVRAHKPHPLMAKHSEFRFELGTIKWNKVIFKDKFDLLLQERKQESKRGSILPATTDKGYKKVLNLVRTLAPVKFDIQPKNASDGEGFTITPFEKIDETTTRIDPIFDALFFCAIDTTKKVLAYTPKPA